MLGKAAPFGRGRVAGADGDAQVPQRLLELRGGRTDPGQGRAQVALDVVDQGLERRDVEDAHAGPVVIGEPRRPVDPPQERGQGLARPGRRDEQRMIAPGDDRPTGRLDLGPLGKLRAEPGLGGGVELEVRIGRHGGRGSV